MEQALAGASRRLVESDRLVVFEREHGQALFGFARRLGLTDVEAMDVVQDLFLRLHHQLGTGREMTNDRGWAFQATYRLAMDRHRARRRELTLLERMAPTTSSRDGAALDDRIAVWAAVDHLPQRQREVIYLRYRADLPFDQVGRVLGISASAARSHATQAMATLRRELGSEEGPE